MQSFANHTKWDPKWHFVAVPILLLNVLYRVFDMVDTEISPASIWEIAVAAALVLVALSARLNALKVQDRLIRLEERLRMAALLPPPLQARAGELTEAQLIGLRFASDEELPALVEETLKSHMGTKQIKQAVKNWRVDDFRV